VMRVKRQFAEEVKHREAEREHTVSLHLGASARTDHVSHTGGGRNLPCKQSMMALGSSGSSLLHSMSLRTECSTKYISSKYSEPGDPRHRNWEGISRGTVYGLRRWCRCSDFLRFRMRFPQLSLSRQCC
jgi:hypothetical protein